MYPLMIFAAGFGTRMNHPTLPKPLVPVAGRPLIDHALAIAQDAGAQKTVVNLHHRGDLIADHLAGKATLSWERDQILDTGGGLRAALPLLGADTVMALNSDAVWTGQNPLRQLMAAWQPDSMDILLLLLPRDQATGHSGAGDFILAKDGRISRAKGADAPIYLGAQILKTSCLNAVSETVFSMGQVWDDRIAAGRAYGVIHQGGWCDVGTPQGVAMAERMLNV